MYVPAQQAGATVKKREISHFEGALPFNGRKGESALEAGLGQGPQRNRSSESPGATLQIPTKRKSGSDSGLPCARP